METEVQSFTFKWMKCPPHNSGKIKNIIKMSDAIKNLLGIIFVIYLVISVWQLTFDPYRWFTNVESGQIWVWDQCDDDPFECNQHDTIWIKQVQGNYVQCISKPWFGSGQIIKITYKKQLFNQSMFYRIK